MTGDRPSSRARATPRSKACTCVAVASGCALAARARCDQSPETRTDGHARAAVKSASQADAGAPPRDIPVSSSRCTSAASPRAAMASRVSMLAQEMVTFRATAARRSHHGSASQQSTGAVIPADRRASASSTVATPSHAAPESSAVVATSMMPWPKPSAFTTARIGVAVMSRMRPILRAIAPRSTMRVASGEDSDVVSGVECGCSGNVMPPEYRWAAAAHHRPR